MIDPRQTVAGRFVRLARHRLTPFRMTFARSLPHAHTRSTALVGRVGLCIPLLLASCVAHPRNVVEPPQAAASPPELEVHAHGHECGPQAPGAISLRRHPERPDAIIVTLSPAIAGRVEVRALAGTEGVFEANGRTPEASTWELDLSADTPAVERIFRLEESLATHAPALQLAGFTASGETWISIDATLPARSPAPAPAADRVRHPVLIPLPDGTHCVEYMTAAEAARRGLEIARTSAPVPLDGPATENGGE